MENTSTSPNPIDPADSNAPDNFSAPLRPTDPLHSQPDAATEIPSDPSTAATETPTPAFAEPSTITPSPAEPVAATQSPLSAPAENTPQMSPTTISDEPTTPVTPEPPRAPRRLPLKKLLPLGAGLVLLIAVGAGSYLLGKHTATAATVSMTSQQTAMTVPKDATVIEQCSPGFGTQYVLPKDIPGGPVYNVYQGKLIGIEYMTDLATTDKLDLMLKNLPLFAQKYDHLDIMAMEAHAGYPRPHYQVDVMMVPSSVSSKITCGSSNSSDMNSSMSSSTNSTMNNSTTSNSTASM